MKNNNMLAEQLIDSAKTCILTSIDGDGFPQSRAMMGIRKREGLKHVYFSTNTSSQKVRQLSANPKSCLYFFDADRFIGVMLIGTMEALSDSAHRELIWRAGDELYYPQGVYDPDYTVLRFTAHTLRLYSNFTTTDVTIE